MGKVKGFKDTCVRCGKEIWIALNKDKHLSTDGRLCTKCRNKAKINQEKGIREEHTIRLVSDKVNLKSEVEALRRIEKSNPLLVERLRKGEKKENT